MKSRMYGVLLGVLVVTAVTIPLGAFDGPQISGIGYYSPLNLPVIAPDDGQSVEERLAALEQRTGWLNDVQVNGSIRVRHEYKSPWNYIRLVPATSPQGDDQTLLRARLGVRYAVSEHLAANFEFQASHITGATASLVSDPGTSAHQAYISFQNLLTLCDAAPDGWDLDVNLGRLRLPALGDQRMISPLDWHNVGRSFDGAHIHLGLGEGMNVEMLYIQLVDGMVASGTVVGAGKDDEIYAIYYTHQIDPSLTYDLYAIARNAKSSTVTPEFGVAGDLEDYTYGSRIEYRQGRMKATVEGALQRGDFSNDNINAYGWAAEVSYGMPKDTAWQPWFAVGATFGSGDSHTVAGGDPDGDHETFRPIAPFGHAYQGHYDLFSWQNGLDQYVKVRVTPCKGVNFHADYHIFRLDSHDDSWYNAGGSAIRAGGTTGRKGIGRELDLYAKWNWEGMKFWFGWSKFWAGSFVDRTGGGGNGHFLFTQVELPFG